MIYTYSIEKTYTPKVKRTIETENATPTAMEAFAKKLQSSYFVKQKSPVDISLSHFD